MGSNNLMKVSYVTINALHTGTVKLKIIFQFISFVFYSILDDEITRLLKSKIAPALGGIS